MKTFSLSILLISSLLLTAHKSGSDNPILDSKRLDANSICTWFRNNGSFNYDPFNQNNPGFEWPCGSNKFARFASGVWTGARVGNDTLVTVAEYSFEYTPGYTDNNGNPQGWYDPLYKIYKLYLGVNDPDRMNWPNALLGNSDQGAPVYFDNQTNSWRPLDFGHQTLFYRITDSYPESHVNYQTAPLKVDVIRLDFAVNILGGLNAVAFSQFTFINRSTGTWNNAYLTIWTDDDLGYAVDDKVGCDSARHLGYTYNATNNDPIYGSMPPAVGFLVLRGALIYTGNNNDTVYICRNKTRVALIGYRDRKMSVFNWYENSSHPVNGNPQTGQEAYRYMSGFRRDGSPIINPIGGYQTKHMFTGDPVTGQGWIQPGQSDQRFIVSSGPVNMAPGDTQVIVIAQVIARGSSNLNSITALRQLSDIVRNYYNTCYTSPPIGIELLSEQLPDKFQLYQNYPNPFNPVTTIKYDLPKNEFVRIKIYNLIGEEVALLVNEFKNAGSYNVIFNGTNFASGLYIYRIEAGSFVETKKLVLIK